MVRIRSVIYTIGVSFALVVATGCGGSGADTKPEPNSVSGKLTVKGGPPAAGSSIKYTPADGKTIVTTVNADGSYLFTDLPLGEARIAVTGNGGKPVLPGTATNGLPIPKKYAKPGVVPAFKVVKGANTNNIDLTP